MSKSRLEAFSDGVLAIIITIMVLELRIPDGAGFEALSAILPIFISYVLSFVFIAIYWGNHHHLLHTVHHMTSGIMWANMFLLFSLSLIPFTTGWMGHNHFDKIPVALYASNLLLCAIAYYILQKTIMSHYTHSTALIEALKKQDKKGLFSLLIYILSIPCAFFYPIVSALLFVFIAVIWVRPDKNIEQALKENK